MAKEFKAPISVTLGPDLVFLWPILFEPDSRDNKYTVCALIPKSNTAMVERVESAIDQAIERGYETGKFRKNFPEDRLHTPLKDGDMAEGENADLFRGYYYFNASSKWRPGVYGPDKQEIFDAEKFEFGAIGAISVNAYPYDVSEDVKGGKTGVGLGINHLLKLKDSLHESIAPKVDAAAAFAEFGGVGQSPATPRQSRRRSGSDDPMLG